MKRAGDEWRWRGWLGLAVLVAFALTCAACERSAETAKLFCRHFEPPGPGEARNPLLPPDQVVCYDDAKACAGPGDNADVAACMPVPRPAWHCYTARSDDPVAPLNSGSGCYPHKAMCDSSRPNFGDTWEISACAPASAVFCFVGTRSHGLMCFITDAECQLMRGLSEVLQLAEPDPRSACTAYASAR